MNLAGIAKSSLKLDEATNLAFELVNVDVHYCFQSPINFNKKMWFCIIHES